MPSRNSCAKTKKIPKIEFAPLAGAVLERLPDWTFPRKTVPLSDYPATTRVTLLMKITQSCQGGIDRGGDSQAWNEFVTTYSPLVTGWCKKLGLDDEQSNDASQEVLLKLLSALREFRYDPARGRFRAWLKTLTSNLVRDLQRSARSGDVGSGDSRIMHLLSQVEDPRALGELGDIFVKQYDEELLEMASQQVRQRVEPKSWQVWESYAIRQEEARTVADQLNIPIAEVYVAKSRITKMLREEIARMEQGNT